MAPSRQRGACIRARHAVAAPAGNRLCLGLWRQIHRFEDPNKVEKYSPKFLGDGLRYEIADFVSKINGADKKSYYLTRGESIAMAGVVERFMKKRR